MRKIFTLAKKEWWGYFTNPTGYVFAGLLMIVALWLFINDMFVINLADLKSYWSILGFLLTIFVPAISMNLLAEEKKNSTWEILLSLPVNEAQLVLGKFLGCALYLIFTLLLSLPLMGTMMLLGRPDTGPFIGGLLGILLLGLAYLSVGIFSSSLGSQPVVGFLVATVILLVNSLVSQDSVVSRLPAGISNLLMQISLSSRSTNFFTGLFEVRDLVFFGSWIAVFLILTVLVLKNRGK